MAGVAIRGSFAELGRLVQALQSLSGTGKQRLIGALAEAAKTEIQLSFEQGRDPYGSAWKPPVTRPGGRPLRDTGRLANSFNAKVRGGGFEVSTNVAYAATHNYGVTIHAKSAEYLKFKTPWGWRSKREVTIPRRQFIPSNGRLGPYWTAGLWDAASAAMRGIVG